MITEELVEFIKRQQKIGVSRETLEKILAPHGWTSADMDEALRAIVTEAKELAAANIPGGVTAPVPNPTPAAPTPLASRPPVTFGDISAPEGETSEESEMADLDIAAGQAVGVSTPEPKEAVASAPVTPLQPERPKDAVTPMGPPPSSDVMGAIERGRAESSDAKLAQSMATPIAPAPMSPIAPAPSPTPTPVVPPPAAPAPALESTPAATTPPAPAAMPTAAMPNPATPPNPTPNSMATPAPVGMQTASTPADLVARGHKKNHVGIAVLVIVLLLLVGGAALQLFGVISIPGLPVLVGKEKAAVDQMAGFVMGDSVGSVDFQATMQLNHATDAAQSVQATLSGRHEFFSPEQQAATYTFRVARGSVTAAGEVRILGDAVWLRFSEASDSVELLGQPMGEYLGAWFRFDAGLLAADGYLLFDPNQVEGPLAPTGETLSDTLVLVLDGLTSAPATAAEVGQLADGQVAAQIEASASWTQDVTRQVLRSIDRWLGGYADSQEVVAILDTLRNGAVVALIQQGSGQPDVISVPLRAQAADFGELSGNLEVRFNAFNQTVDVPTPTTSVVSFTEYLSAKQSGATEGLAIDGTQLLRRTLQDARITTVIDALSIAGRDARETYQTTNTYEGTCSAATTNQAFAALVETFPEVSPECQASESEFMLFTAFDGGYVCADSNRFVGLLDEAPVGNVCVEPASTPSVNAIDELAPTTTTETPVGFVL